MRFVPYFVFGLALLFQGLAHAQVPPDAGAIRQQIERQLPQQPLPASAAPLEVESTAPLVLPDDVRLTVKSFRIAGNTLLPDVQLQPVVQPWVGRPVGFADLQQATQAVANAFRDAGWIVRAYLPQQDITEGVVLIRVIESVFSGVRLAEPLPTLVRPAIITEHIKAQQKPDKPLNAKALDRGLLLADDLPGVTVSGVLEPGASQGQTALVLKARDEPRFDGEVGVDNGGARSTGAVRGTVSAGWNSPLGRGDRARVDALKSSGSSYGRLGYNLPVGADGWRVGVNSSWLDYRLVGSEFSSLKANGNSSSVGLEASYPLLRQRMRNLYLTMAADERRFSNEANTMRQSKYRVAGFTAGLSGNLYDTLGGGGANSAMLSWAHGRVRQGSPDVGENPAYAGAFNKLRFAVSRQQTLTSTLSAFGAISGQYASKALDSSERFYLGGPNGVRAYPVNEAGGSRAEMVNLELRWRLPKGVTATALYDWGRVGNHGAGPDYNLKGGGMSLGWTGPRGISVKATVAVRTGKNPNPTATGMDQDGSRHRVRGWLQASVPF